jgi:RNA polymerase sigma factor (TIGR02999 family)
LSDLLVQTLSSIDLSNPEESVAHAFDAYYPELKRIARARLAGSAAVGDLSTTALVHESFLKLSNRENLPFDDRVRFLAYAAQVIRSIIIDTIRQQRASKRGGDMQVVTLSTNDVDADLGIQPDQFEVVRVHDALNELSEIDMGLARLVEMRFFAGLSEDEIANALAISPRSVRREWHKARALLLTLLQDSSS